MPSNEQSADTVATRLYDVDTNDPASALVDRSTTTPEERQEIHAVMQALARFRTAEKALSEASQRYMKLGPTDMRALHYLIVSRNTNAVATPSAIAAHLGISTASTTKLLDRLEAGGHIVRSPHPTDRRALAITITQETHDAAMATIGHAQAQRFNAAARLSPEERRTVIRFLDDMGAELGGAAERWGAP